MLAGCDTVCELCLRTHSSVESVFTTLRVDITFCLLSSLTSGLVDELDLGPLSSSGLSGPRLSVITVWLQSPGTPHSQHLPLGSVACPAGDSSTLVFRLRLRNFDCLLGGREGWFLALAHDCHIHDLVEVLCLWVLDRGDLSVSLQARSRLLESLLPHSLLQRLGLLLSGCTVGVCAVRVRAVWLQLVRARPLLALSESASAPGEGG